MRKLMYNKIKSFGQALNKKSNLFGDEAPKTKKKGTQMKKLNKASKTAQVFVAKLVIAAVFVYAARMYFDGDIIAQFAAGVLALVAVKYTN